MYKEDDNGFIYIRQFSHWVVAGKLDYNNYEVIQENTSQEATEALKKVAFLKGFELNSIKERTYAR